MNQQNRTFQFQVPNTAIPGTTISVAIPGTNGTMPVQLPPNTRPGQMMQISLPDTPTSPAMHTITVPAGATPGMNLNVQLPDGERNQVPQQFEPTQPAPAAFASTSITTESTQEIVSLQTLTDSPQLQQADSPQLQQVSTSLSTDNISNNNAIMCESKNADCYWKMNAVMGVLDIIFAVIAMIATMQFNALLANVGGDGTAASAGGEYLSFLTALSAFFVAYALKKGKEGGSSLLCGAQVVSIIMAVLAIVTAILCGLMFLAYGFWSIVCSAVTSEVDDNEDLNAFCSAISLGTFAAGALTAVNIIMSIGFIGGACVAGKLKTELASGDNKDVAIEATPA